MLISRRDFLRASAVVGGLALAPELLGACSSPPATTSESLSGASRFEIHPSVGIARVGNSTDAFFFGPEVPGALPVSPGGFKDATGAMAKQAARFRIYGFGPHGEPLGDVTGDVHVEWTVAVANKKPSWYQYFTAMDIAIAQPVTPRNPTVTGAAREGLATSSVRSVAGRGAAPVHLDAGVVFGHPVDFGELLTDKAGHLVVLPGDGQAAKLPGATIVSFSDNDGWVDNVCDGTVRAVVSVGGRRVAAVPAYLLVTPPNYGPSLAEGPVTLLDEIRSPLTEAGMVARQPVVFNRDILPIFSRLVDMQWVNKGFFDLSRPGGQMDWLEPAQLERLADPSPANRPYRSALAAQFRTPASPSSVVTQQPLIIGDGGVTMPPSNQYSWLPLTPHMYSQLQAWARGDFEPGPAVTVPASLDDVAVADQPAALDQAGLASVLGGANHPGVEAPWILRVPTMWDAAYRLHVQGDAMELRDYGPVLTPAVTMGPTGPVHGVTPGDLTMWMGVPWQADAASCRDGYRIPTYTPDVSPYLPAYWPARVPNEVLTEDDYRTVMDESLPLAERSAAFARRRTWIRAVAHIPEPVEQFTVFISEWPSFGVVENRPGPRDGKFPATIKVETGVAYQEPVATSQTEYPCRTTPGITCPIVW